MIGVLNAYHFDFTPGNYQELYNRDISEFLTRSFPSEPIRHYKIAKSEWPLSLDECRIWVITGSGKGAYEDLPWIVKLQNWIQQLHLRRHKLIGLCFGHQIIVQALGGKVEKSAKGWGVGVRSFQVVQHKVWMKPAQSKLDLIFSHQDQVVAIPESAEVLAESEFCPFQMVQFQNHILTVQGHPEFSVELAKVRLLSRREAIGESTFAAAMLSLAKTRDDRILSSWFREFAKDEA